jgi:hypothetical protein
MNTIAPQHLARRAAKGIYFVVEGIASAAVAVVVVFSWFVSATWPSSRH